MEMMPKLDWNNFPPNLRAFGLRLTDLLAKLDGARLGEHVALLRSAPGGFGDAEHLGDPAVFSLLAYGEPGLRALYQVATSDLPAHHIAKHNAERALVAASRQRSDVALSMTHLAQRYLDDAAFTTLQERVRTTCENALLVTVATELFEYVIDAILSSERPEAIGTLLDQIGILFGREENVEKWVWRVILRNHRQRDAFNLLWDGRHLVPDLSKAVLDTAPERPVSVAFLDMNGLKAINDSAGHDAGDAAIKAFLGAICTMPGTATGYRRSGDEAVVVFQGTHVGVAADGIRSMLRTLSFEGIRVGGDEMLLTASCGLVSTSAAGENPKTLLDRADREMYRAKAASRTSVRRSAIAVEGAEVEFLG